MSWIHRIAPWRSRRQTAPLPRLRHPTAVSAGHQVRPSRRRRSCPGRRGPDTERAGGPGSSPARRSPKFPTRSIPPLRRQARFSPHGGDPDGGAVGRVRAAGSSSCRVLWARSAGAAGGPGRRTAQRRWTLRPPHGPGARTRPARHRGDAVRGRSRGSSSSASSACGSAPTPPGDRLKAGHRPAGGFAVTAELPILKNTTADALLDVNRTVASGEVLLSPGPRAPSSRALTTDLHFTSVDPPPAPSVRQGRQGRQDHQDHQAGGQLRRAMSATCWRSSRAVPPAAWTAMPFATVMR